MKGQGRKIIGVSLKWIRFVAIYQDIRVFIILFAIQFLHNGIASPGFPPHSKKVGRVCWSGDRLGKGVSSSF